MKSSLFKVLLDKARLYTRGQHRYDLVIYDDIYPHPASGFRMEEFTHLLTNIPNSRIIASGTAYRFFNVPDGLHEKHIGSLLQSIPSLSGQIKKAAFAGDTQSRLFYCVFLHNMYRNIEWVETQKVPFVFTLYPGGGFCLGSKETDEQLRRIFGSPFFRKVIVTQRKTYEYLIGEKFCIDEDILFVFGVVVPQSSIQATPVARKKYPADKEVINVCFCAAKYTEKGEDKGYPLFTDLVKAMAARYDFLRFHVIGGFDRDVIDVREVGSKITFYGYQDFLQLRAIFHEMDIIISPNQPDLLSKGAFDGFPLGTVIEAAFNGVAVMLTDCFGENRYFEDGKELIIIQPQLNDLLEKFEGLINEPQRIYDMAALGKARFSELYSSEYQLKPRLQLLESLITAGL